MAKLRIVSGQCSKVGIGTDTELVKSIVNTEAPCV